MYSLVYADPTAADDASMAHEGFASLRKLGDRAAQAEQFRVGVLHAAQLLAAAGQGVMFRLIATPAERRDPDLFAATREAVIAPITLPPYPGRIFPTEAGLRPGQPRVRLRCTLRSPRHRCPLIGRTASRRRVARPFSGRTI